MVFCCSFRKNAVAGGPPVTAFPAAASVVADALSGLSGTWRQRASLNSDLCKSVLRVSDCRPAGSQAQFLSTFTSWHGSWCGVADVQPAAGISFAKMTAN